MAETKSFRFVLPVTLTTKELNTLRHSCLTLSERTDFVTGIMQPNTYLWDVAPVTEYMPAPCGFSQSAMERKVSLVPKPSPHEQPSLVYFLARAEKAWVRG